jgi:glycosyltransferase involved in cell wall biosynthesis
VVPNGVPITSPAEPPRRSASAEFVVGGVGRLHRQKGFDVLVRAVARLPGTHLVLVGDGPERASLEHLADRLGVADRVSVTGWVETVSGWLSIVDVLAMPSRFEGLPLALLEAMLAERPVVGTDVGSIGDALRHGETGLVVPVDDELALTDALGRLREDPGLRRRLGRAGAELARDRFTVGAMARAYEEVYAEVLRRR